MNCKKLTLWAFLLSAPLFGGPLLADPASDRIDALTEQVKALSQEVQALRQQVNAGKPAAPTTPTNAVSSDPTLKELDQKVRVLERKNEIAQEAAVEKSKQTPRISVGSSGFSLSSADTNFLISLRGVLQLDSRTFFSDHGIPGNDGFVLRRARPILEGTVYRDFDFLFVPDFGTSANGGNNGSQPTPQIFDAYLNYRYQPELQLRVGKFKSPIGLEQLQPDPSTAFNERALPTELTPNRDLGAMLHGEAFASRVAYAAGIFNGVGDNRNSSNSDFEDDKDFEGRLFLQPWKPSAIRSLEGLGFGVAGSYGNSATSAGLPNGGGYVTDGQQQFFAYKSSVTAAGTHWRLMPQAYYYYGPFSLMGEYAISSQQVRFTNSTSIGTFENSGWEVTGSWVLTGEDASYKGVNPSHPFSLVENQWGAFQLVARYGQLNLDDSIFSPTSSLSFADPQTSAEAADAWAVGLNWWLNKNIRISTSFSRTTFEGGSGPNTPATTAPGVVTRQPENVLFTRVQLAF